MSDEAYEQYRQDFVADVRDAGYYEDVEKGILMLADDLQAGRVELKYIPHEIFMLNSTYSCLRNIPNTLMDG